MITELPSVIEPPPGEAAWGTSAAGHPMRLVTREVAFDPASWTPARQAEVAAFFDELAPDWNSRNVAGRERPIFDALDRGIGAAPDAVRRVGVELGGGTGMYAAALAEQFPTLVTMDLSAEMMRLVPPSAALRVQGDGSNLPVADGSVDALILINMFLFPAEVDRVLSPSGVVVWVSSRGPDTPIHLPASDVDQALPGDWTGVAAQAGWGTWSVHWRTPT